MGHRGAAVGVAIVTVLSGVFQERYKQITTRRDESALKVQDGCLVLPSGRLPKVAQINAPCGWGVHPAIVLTATPDKQPPVYVPRDIDKRVRERPAAGEFVLLVGDSIAGKSRTVFEAMRGTLPDHLLIAPHDRTALPAAIEHAARAGRAVLWLSDLEHYLGTGGLTREHIARLTTGKGHRVILATLRSAEQARLTSQPADSDQAARSTGREVQETLEQADPIRLPRTFSPTELDRAHSRTWDPRIASAVLQAGEFGIAEYLASGPELQRDVDNAWDVGVQPAGGRSGRRGHRLPPGGIHQPCTSPVDRTDPHHLPRRQGRSPVTPRTPGGCVAVGDPAPPRHHRFAVARARRRR